MPRTGVAHVKGDEPRSGAGRGSTETACRQAGEMHLGAGGIAVY